MQEKPSPIPIHKKKRKPNEELDDEDEEDYGDFNEDGVFQNDIPQYVRPPTKILPKSNYTDNKSNEVLYHKKSLALNVTYTSALHQQLAFDRSVTYLVSKDQQHLSSQQCEIEAVRNMPLILIEERDIQMYSQQALNQYQLCVTGNDATSIRQLLVCPLNTLSTMHKNKVWKVVCVLPPISTSDKMYFSGSISCVGKDTSILDIQTTGNPMVMSQTLSSSPSSLSPKRVEASIVIISKLSEASLSGWNFVMEDITGSPFKSSMVYLRCVGSVKQGQVWNFSGSNRYSRTLEKDESLCILMYMEDTELAYSTEVSLSYKSPHLGVSNTDLQYLRQELLKNAFVGSARKTDGIPISRNPHNVNTGTINPRIRANGNQKSSSRRKRRTSRKKHPCSSSSDEYDDDEEDGDGHHGHSEKGDDLSLF
jgi:hypothetical protein